MLDDARPATPLEVALIDALDTVEAELMRSRQQHDALPTYEHLQAHKLLRALGKRNRYRYLHSWQQSPQAASAPHTQPHATP